MRKIGILGVLMVLTVVFAGCGNIDETISGNSIVENITQNKTFARGVWNEKTYTNEFADFEIVVPDEWGVATDKELADLMNISIEETLGDNEIANKIVKEKTVYDAMAQNIYTGSNIIVMYENLALSIGGTSLDEEKYLDILKTQLAQTGETNRVTGQVYEEKIGEHTYYALPTELSDFGVKQVYYTRKIDNYMACILTTTVGDEDLKAMIK